MENIYENLLRILKQYDGLSAENGSLYKNKVQELCLKNDEKLIELLLSDPKCKEHFFSQVGDATIFNKDELIKLVYSKKFLPDSYTKFSEKIGLANEDEFIVKNQEVVLNWPYKDCILEGGMTKEEKGRDEIFWNEVIAPEHITRLKSPKAFMNGKRIDAKGSKRLNDFSRGQDGTIEDNLIIKGNNLLALYSLREEFAGKVKLVYIDPPFNTENDSFKYNDQFNHSSWLTFMKDRLREARKLLRPDGIIFVHCDDIEQAYLKVLMDEVFGRENFVSNVAVKSSTPSGTKTAHKEKTLIKIKDHLIVFRKDNIKLNPQYSRSINWDKHYNHWFDPVEAMELVPLRNILKKEKVKEENYFNTEAKDFREFYLRNSEKIVCLSGYKNTKIKEECRKKPNEIIKFGDCYYRDKRMIQPLSKSIKKVIIGGYKMGDDIAQLVCDFWQDIDFNNTQNEGGVSLPTGKKPETLLMRIIEMATSPGDTVLDFFLGSGTTAAVAHKMGRQYIGVEQMDYVDDIACERLKKVVKGEQGGVSKIVEFGGGGNFVYLELAEWNQKWVKEIKQAQTKRKTKGLWGKLKKHAFLSCKIDVRKVDKNAKEFDDLSLDDQKKFLLDCLDANHLYINYSEIEDQDYAMKPEDKELSRSFYRK